MSAIDNPSALVRILPALLILGVLVLLPVARASDGVLIFTSAIGVWFLWQRRKTLRGNFGLRLVALLFACYWLPALISAFDAVQMQRSWSTVGALLRFFPFAAFTVLALSDAAQWPRIIQAIAAIVTLWLLDAWVQIFTGFSVAGAMDADRLSGIFGAENLKLGPVLAVLSPFVMIAAREAFGRRGLIVAFVFMLLPVLYAGSRAGWLMYAAVVFVLIWRETHSPLRFAAWALAAVTVFGIAGFAAEHASLGFGARVDRSLLALQGSEDAIDQASAGRLRIWGTALRMSAAHPVNGVGVRGFRYAYETYALPGDSFVHVRTEEGASHAHQLILEVLSETGVIGLLLWLTGAVAAVRAWLLASAQSRSRAFAPALALAAMCFPIDTHLAFYSAWWGLLFWWLLALYCAALYTRSDASHDNA